MAAQTLLLPVLASFAWGAQLPPGNWTALLEDSPSHDKPSEDEGELDASAPYHQELFNNYDLQYTATISIGGQPLTTVLDTGSFELLVFSSRCSACGTSHGLYAEEKSSTLHRLNFMGEHSFGSGTTKSYEAYELVEIGPIKEPKQHMWEVVDADMAILADDFFHAILGIGPPQGAVMIADANAQQARTNTFWSSSGSDAKHLEVVANHIRRSRGFVDAAGIRCISICLGKESGSPGNVIWNDDALEKEPSKFTPVALQGSDMYWSTELKNVRVSAVDGGPLKATTLGCSHGKKCTAVLDTGSSLIMAPKSVITNLQNLVEDFSDPAGDCSDLRGLPDLQFELDGKLFSLPPSAYVGRVDGISNLDNSLQALMPQLLQKRSPKARNDCQVVLMATDDLSENEMWILGMPFFRKYYSSFQFDGSKAVAMSFATADDRCQPADPSDSLLRRESLDRAMSPLHFNASWIKAPIRMRASLGLAQPRPAKVTKH